MLPETVALNCIDRKLQRQVTVRSGLGFRQLCFVGDRTSEYRNVACLFSQTLAM